TGLTGCDEDGRRAVKTLQQRFCVVQVVGIAVVEGQSHHAPERPPGSQRPVQLMERDNPVMASEDLQLLGETLRCHGQQLRIVREPLNAVVHQDQATRCEGSAKSLPDPLQPPWYLGS